MDTCQHCGTVLPTGGTGGRYCPNCGVPVEALASLAVGGGGPGASQTHLATPGEHPYEAFFRPPPGEPSPHTRTQVMPAIPAQAPYVDPARPDAGQPGQGYGDQGPLGQGYPEQPYLDQQSTAQPAYDQPIDYQAAPGRPYSEPYEGPYADDYNNGGYNDGGPAEPPRSSRAAMIGVGVAAAAIVVIIVSLITLGGGKSAPTPQANTQPTEVLTPSPHKATDSAPSATTPTTSASATPMTHVPGTLQLGDSGAEVKWLQNRLKQLGVYNGDATGTFDQATAAAVAAFQSRAHTADATGVVGRSTKTALIAWGSRPRLNIFTGDPGGKKRNGTSPDDVKRLQRALSVALNQDVKATGTYDVATAGAVMQYEAAVGLAPDGATGDKVWAALQQGKLSG
jgi:peptidoglycan hydrolase-like protein with peptidoglycan-binding domain